MIYYIYDEEMDIEWGPYTERSEAETNAAKISGDVAESRIDEFVEVAKRKVNEALISYTSACISVGAKYKFNKTEWDTLKAVVDFEDFKDILKAPSTAPQISEYLHHNFNDYRADAFNFMCRAYIAHQLLSDAEYLVLVAAKLEASE